MEAKRIALYNAHTGEAVKTVFWESGRFLSGALTEIDQLLRDYRTDEIRHMDPRLIDLLWRIHRITEAREPFTVVSGYRSPQTNELLRKVDHGVAKHSYHMTGQAVDIQLPGIALKRLYRVARSQKAGGVGYYGKSAFIHVDTGPIRYW